MITRKMLEQNPLLHADFPLASRYDASWVAEGGFGANPLICTLV